MNKLDIKYGKKDTHVLEVFVNGELRGFAFKSRPRDSLLRTIYYIVGQVDPSISKDSIDYSLDELLKGVN